MLSAGGSFGGAQPKALIEIGSEQWLIKFFNDELIDVPLIEHATLTLGKKAGITVVDTRFSCAATTARASCGFIAFPRRPRSVRKPSVARNRNSATPVWRNSCAGPVWRTRIET